MEIGFNLKGGRGGGGGLDVMLSGLGGGGGGGIFVLVIGTALEISDPTLRRVGIPS